MKETIQNRYDFVLLFDVENGNPNGDPDAGNLPRIDPETSHGLVTDVCIKRKVRNYVELVKGKDPGYDIYVKEGSVLNLQHKKAYEALKIEPVPKKLPKDERLAKELTLFMCQNFYDIRTFGAVMTTEVNCGQVRGPVQFNFSKSLDPIIQQEVTITRMAVTKEGDAENKGQEMGRKFIVPYGLYRMEGYVSAHLAQQTQFNEEDLELLWKALVNMFDHDHSAARGKMVTRNLFIFKHNSILGNAPAHLLFDTIQIKRKDENRPVRAFSDYDITVNREGIPAGVELIMKP